MRSYSSGFPISTLKRDQISVRVLQLCSASPRSLVLRSKLCSYKCSAALRLLKSKKEIVAAGLDFFIENIRDVVV